MSRPALNELANRRAPDLHRTLPTWVREQKDNGKIEWRVYVPHRRFGGALLMALAFAPDTPRSKVAADLRGARKVLWGTDKQNTDIEPQEKVRRPRSAKADPSASDQLAADDSGSTDMPQPSADDDMPPWPEGEQAADAPAETAPAAPAALGFPEVPSPESDTDHGQGSLF